MTKRKLAATSHNPWAESRVRNLNSVDAAGVQPEDQRWGFWQIQPMCFPQLRDDCGALAPEAQVVSAGFDMSLHLIPNEDLLVERIPDPEAELWGWERFAHTINGYDVIGGFKQCADLVNSGTPLTLTELRCCLFFEA